MSTYHFPKGFDPYSSPSQKQAASRERLIELMTRCDPNSSDYAELQSLYALCLTAESQTNAASGQTLSMITVLFVVLILGMIVAVLR